MEAGNVRPVSIDVEMRGAYLDYAMSVITSRALPDVRDGLKPVQRRILYAMDELSLRSSSSYKKSARIVGEVLGKYHPHGDAPVYETMVRMAQDFSLRYLLVDGQGNFGSVDGDPPAAMRYTEARLSAIAEEMLADIDKDTVEFVPNFDDTLKEPSVLPARLPNLLVNGSSGIAVGMATNIPPHNLGEVVDAINFVLTRLEPALQGGAPPSLLWAVVFNQPVDTASILASLDGLSKEWSSKVKTIAQKAFKRPSPEDYAQTLIQLVTETVEVLPEELLQFVKGPDFPTAGIVQGAEGIRSAYATGHGRIVVRARAHIEDMRGNRQQLVVTELPFQLNKSSLLEKIAELVRDRRIEGISELRDESDRQGMRIVIELRRDVSSRQVLNQLYRYTQMQTTFSMNMLALVDGQPRVLNLAAMLQHYIQYRQDVLTRRTRYELAKARAREHILQGLKIALDHLDEVIALIRRSRDAETARTGLMRQFKLSDIQAQAILDMQLRRLAALERRRIIEELEAILKQIAGLEDLLAHPSKILGLIRGELADLKTKYGDARRTAIIAEEVTEFTEEDLIPEQEVIVLVTGRGYVRRVPTDSFLSRRGRGQSAIVTQEDDTPRWLAQFNTHDTAIFFSQMGRAFAIRTHDLPDVGKNPRGAPLGNFLSLSEGERVVAGFPAPKLDGEYFCLLATAKGEVKRLAFSDMGNLRASGIQVIGLAQDDELLSAELTDGTKEMILVANNGQALRFAESDLRSSGRGSGGVRGMRLGRSDAIVSAMVVQPGADLISVTSKGFIKKTEINEYPTQGRGGGGIKATTLSARNGQVAGAVVAGPKSEILIASVGGLVIRATADSVARMGRSAQGVRFAEIAENDSVSNLWAIAGNGTPPVGAQPETAPPPLTEPTAHPARRSPRGTLPPAAAKDQPTTTASRRRESSGAAQETAKKPSHGDAKDKKALEDPKKSETTEATSKSSKDGRKKAITPRDRSSDGLLAEGTVDLPSGAAANKPTPKRTKTGDFNTIAPAAAPATPSKRTPAPKRPKSAPASDPTSTVDTKTNPTRKPSGAGKPPSSNTSTMQPRRTRKS